MPIVTQLGDGSGGDNRLKINGEGEASVVVHPHPPRDEDIVAKPFRQYFTDNGKATGSNDMRVDGSTTEISFAIAADKEEDLYIKSCDLLIADASATLEKFGALTALSNGIKFTWVTQDLGETVIHEGLTTNFEVIRLCDNQPSIGSTTTAFRANNISGNAEGYSPSIDLANVFGLPWGLRLRAGTNDCLQWIVRDDLSTGMDAFDIIGYGIKF